METTTYYDILKVGKMSTQKEIREAYKMLILAWHPDKHPDNKEYAELMFKKITQAYNVLSNEKKRLEYDKFGDIADELENYYDPYEAINKSTQDDTVPNVIARIDVNIKDLYNGIEKMLSFDRYSKCDECCGYGTRDKKDGSCRNCKGRGFEVSILKGGIINQKKCNICNGFGIMTELCEVCNGIKAIKETVTLNIRVPQGAHANYVITVPNEGNYVPDDERMEGQYEHERTNLICVVNEISDQTFKRGVYLGQLKQVSFADLLTEVTVSFEESIDEFIRILPHINGNNLTISINDVIQNGDIYVIENMGMPKLNNPNEYGNLFIKFIVNRPCLSKAQRRRIYQIITNKSYVETVPHIIDHNIVRFEEWLSDR